MEKKMINIQDIEDVLTENGIEISEKIGKKQNIFGVECRFTNYYDSILCN